MVWSYRRPGVVALAVALLLVLSACTGGDSVDGDDREDESDATASAVDRLAEAWSGLDPDAFGAATDDPGAAAETLTAMDDELSVSAATVEPQGDVACADDTCTQQLAVALDLAGIGTWEYDTEVSVEVADDPVVRWEPTVLHPRLTADTEFQRSRRLLARASIVDREGFVLTRPRPAFRIGVVPGKARPESYPRLAALLDIDGADLRQRAAAADPEWFVDVITYRLEDYRPIRKRLFRIPGVSVDFQRLPLAPTSTWGRAVLGSVSPATEESLEGASDLALDTDLVGSSGLQAAFEKQLAGSPGGSVSLIDARSGARRETLWRTQPEPGEQLRTTLSYDVQQAGELAVAGQQQTTVLVAVDARTGEVLADVNGPEVTSYDTGLVGQYPPGSSFKPVSTAALIAAGQQVDQQVACPSTTVVDGKRFKNYEFTSLPAGSTFADAIAASCNTTVVDRAGELGDRDMTETAEQFGVGAEWDLPLPAFSGSVPPAESLVDRAASMIGQGRVLTSPLGMALVAAAVSSGQARTPSLLEGERGEAVGSLPAATVADLQRIMRMVVTQGTATSLRGLPGQVAAKTGTAEYGTADPPRTHGWMIGYRGNLAFACLVVDGSGGNAAAGPVVRAFLQRAPRTW